MPNGGSSMPEAAVRTPSGGLRGHRTRRSRKSAVDAARHPSSASETCGFLRQLRRSNRCLCFAGRIARILGPWYDPVIMRFVLSTVSLVLVGTLAPACTLITDVDRSKIEDPNQPNPGGGEDRDGGETSATGSTTSSLGSSTLSDDTWSVSVVPSEAGPGLDGGPVDAGPDATPNAEADGGTSDSGSGETPAAEAGATSTAPAVASSSEAPSGSDASSPVSSESSTAAAQSSEAGDASTGDGGS